jgi:16S rRNA (guanine966-N2)-methyltransferase
LRITGGAWRSRRLRGPGRGQHLRPTPDALRERAFAVLGDRIIGARFLDIYAGTGAVGFEALSRGANEVVFVERHRAATKIIKANRDALEVSTAQARLEFGPALRAVRDLSRREQTFDVVWADPPFEQWSEGLEVIIHAFGSGVIKATGIACLECPKNAHIDALPDGLCVRRDLSGGASRVAMIGRVEGQGLKV